MVSEYSRGKRPITAGFVRDVAVVFSELNPDWILREDCAQMLKDGDIVEIKGSRNVVNNGHDQTVGMDTAALHRIIEKQQAQIDRLLGIIEKLQA